MPFQSAQDIPQARLSELMPSAMRIAFDPTAIEKAQAASQVDAPGLLAAPAILAAQADLCARVPRRERSSALRFPQWRP
jgi:hypothetical protein